MDSRIPGTIEAPLGGDPRLAFKTGYSPGVEALHELGVRDVSESSASARPQRQDEWNDKRIDEEVRYVPMDEESPQIGKGMTAAQKVDNEEEIALYALHVDDDPTLNPWTMRTWFLGKSLL